MLDNLKNYNIILASNSPRRKELLEGLGIDFEVRTVKGVREDYPADLPLLDIAQYISAEKATAYKEGMGKNDLLITADTIVIVGKQVIGKPKDKADACRMLRLLRDKTHQVVTGVCLTTKTVQRKFSVMTDVTFGPLDDEEIDAYVERFSPLDKAGAYGIQEWIGFIGVREISGSYYNVMGLPVQRIYQELKAFPSK